MHSIPSASSCPLHSSANATSTAESDLSCCRKHISRSMEKMSAVRMGLPSVPPNEPNVEPGRNHATRPTFAPAGGHSQAPIAAATSNPTLASLAGAVSVQIGECFEQHLVYRPTVIVDQAAIIPDPVVGAAVATLAAEVWTR